MLNQVLTRRISPDFRGGIRLCKPSYTLSGESRGYRVTQLRADGVY